MDEEVVDLSDMSVDPDEITFAHAFPARGLGAMEEAGRFFHVINARPGAGQELTDSLGARGTLLVSGGNWLPENLRDQIDVLNRTVGPCRVVFQNLGALREAHCWPIEEIMKHRGVQSFWFVDDGSGDIPLNVDHKVLMQAQMVDAATLLDAVAFGWGEKSEYTGKSPEAYGYDDAFIPSDLPLVRPKLRDDATRQ
jgi:hypothetical protein